MTSWERCVSDVSLVYEFFYSLTFLVTAPSCGFLRFYCCSTISVKFSFEERIWAVQIGGFETLLLSQACAYTNRLYVTQPVSQQRTSSNMQHVGRTDTAGCAFISQTSMSAFLSCMNGSAVREPVMALNTQSADMVQCLCRDCIARSYEAWRVQLA